MGQGQELLKVMILYRHVLNADRYSSAKSSLEHSFAWQGSGIMSHKQLALFK